MFRLINAIFLVFSHLATICLKCMSNSMLSPTAEKWFEFRKNSYENLVVLTFLFDIDEKCLFTYEMSQWKHNS